MTLTQRDPSVEMRQRGARRRWIKSALGGLPVVLVLLLLWHLLAMLSNLRYLPDVAKVAERYLELLTGPGLTADVLPSVRRAVTGLALAALIGVALGLPLGRFRQIQPWIRPPLEFFRALPAPILLSAAITLLGANDGMRIALIAFACVWPVLLNALDGARNVDPGLIETGRSLGLGSRRLLIRVVLPATLPQILAGVRTASGLAIIMMVISEFIASPDGLGNLVLASQRQFRVADTYAGVLVLGTLGFLINLLLQRLERVLIGWHIQRREVQ